MSLNANFQPLLRLLLAALSLLIVTPLGSADYVLLIDASNSMTTKVSGKTGPTRMDVVIKALKEYLAELPLESKVYIAAFNKGIYDIDELTLRSESQRLLLIEKIDSIQGLTRADAAGRTHLWAALEHALGKGNDYLQAQQGGTVEVRVLTDGGDNDQTTKWAGRSATTVFAELERSYPQIGNTLSANLILLGSFDLQLTGQEAIGIAKVPSFRPVLPPAIVVTPPSPKAGETVRIHDASKQRFDTYDWSVDGQLVAREREFSYNFETAGSHLIEAVGFFGRQKDRGTLTVIIREPDKPEPLNPSIQFEPGDPEPGDSVRIIGQSTGKPVAYNWTVNGKQEGAGTELEHLVLTEGQHEVIFSVRDVTGREEHAIRKISATERPLTVAFHSQPEAVAGTDVVFKNLTRGKAFRWQWSFGDQRPSTEKDPIHRFENSGDEAVTNFVVLEAKTRSGRSFSSTPVPITIHPISKPPKPAFTMTQAAIHVGDQIAFTNHSRGVYNVIQWDFGGEGTSALSDPDFIFSTPGEKDVKLTLTGEGGTAEAHTKITVLPREIHVRVLLANPDAGLPPEVGEVIDFGKINPTHLRQGTLIGIKSDSLQITFSSQPDPSEGLLVTLAGGTNAFELATRQEGKTLRLPPSMMVTQDTIVQVLLRPTATEEPHEAKLTFTPVGNGVFLNKMQTPVAITLRANLDSEGTGGLLFLIGLAGAGIVVFILWKSISTPIITPASSVVVSLTQVLQNPAPGQHPLKLKTPLHSNEVIRFGLRNDGANHVFDLKAPEWSIRRDKSSVRLSGPNQQQRNLILHC
jgi:PKD repeat protein